MSQGDVNFIKRYLRNLSEFTMKAEYPMDPVPFESNPVSKLERGLGYYKMAINGDAAKVINNPLSFLGHPMEFAFSDREKYVGNSQQNKGYASVSEHAQKSKHPTIPFPDFRVD